MFILKLLLLWLLLAQKFPPAFQALRQPEVDPSFGLAAAVGFSAVGLLVASVVSGSTSPASGSASPASSSVAPLSAAAASVLVSVESSSAVSSVTVDCFAAPGCRWKIVLTQALDLGLITGKPESYMAWSHVLTEADPYAYM